MRTLVQSSWEASHSSLLTGVCVLCLCLCLCCLLGFQGRANHRDDVKVDGEGWQSGSWGDRVQWLVAVVSGAD